MNEVMLSTSGDPNAQFVELFDPFGESFPNSPYKIVVYDTNGTSVGSHNVSQALLASRTTPVLISTSAADTALGVTGDEALSVALPTPGQACFTSGIAEQIIHCVAWGCVATPKAGFPSFPAPPDSQSAQRQSSGSYNFGAPTAKMPNNVGTAPSGCAPPDADGDGVPDSSDQCPTTPAQTATGCPPADPGPGPTPDPTPDPTPGTGDPDSSGPTAGDDTLIGNRLANRICGLGGDDTIRGGPGDDVLCGNGGDDRLFGEGGNDRLEGGRGRDRLEGGRGRNRYVAGAGNDRIVARNRRKDRISCGAGRDRASVDRVDVTVGCERVSR